MLGSSITHYAHHVKFLSCFTTYRMQSPCWDTVEFPIIPVGTAERTHLSQPNDRSLPAFLNAEYACMASPLPSCVMVVGNSSSSYFVLVCPMPSLVLTCYVVAFSSMSLNALLIHDISPVLSGYQHVFPSNCSLSLCLTHFISFLEFLPLTWNELRLCGTFDKLHVCPLFFTFANCQMIHVFINHKL